MQPSPLPLHPHTCSNTIDVVFNSTLAAMVRDYTSDASIVTRFDIWIHQSLMGRQGFNTVSAFFHCMCRPEETLTYVSLSPGLVLPICLHVGLFHIIRY